MSAAASRDTVERLLSAAPSTTDDRFRLGAVGDGECTLEVPFRAAFERPGGVVSGPIFMAAADTAIWLAPVTRLGPAETWVTIDLETAFSRAARAGVPVHGTRAEARAPDVAECVRDDGALLSHHTLRYARLPESRAAG